MFPGDSEAAAVEEASQPRNGVPYGQCWRHQVRHAAHGPLLVEAEQPNGDGRQDESSLENQPALPDAADAHGVAGKGLAPEAPHVFQAGADEIKTMVYGNTTVSLERFSKVLSEESMECNATCGVRQTELKHVVAQISKLCEVCITKAPTAVSVKDGARDGILITPGDDMKTVMENVSKLGYDLDEEDSLKVYGALMKLSSGNSVIASKEIDAVVASVAFQVPVTYHLESFVINTGNILTPSCHIRLRKGDEILESVCLGDGPVDAAFKAIEKLVDRQYELDDFQIQAVTEGREAMGETVVKLRSSGKLYSGICAHAYDLLCTSLGNIKRNKVSALRVCPAYASCSLHLSKFFLKYFFYLFISVIFICIAINYI